MPGHQSVPACRVPTLLLPDEHHRATDGERPEEVVHGQVEVERGQRERPVVAADAEAVVEVVDRVPGGAVRYDYALGLAGRAGGEDDVRRITVRHRHRLLDRRVRRRGRHGQRHDTVRQRLGRLGDERRTDTGRAQDAVPAGRRMVGPDRHIGRTRGQAAQHGGDLVRPLGQADRDPVARADGVRGEGGGDPPCPVGEFAVRQ